MQMSSHAACDLPQKCKRLSNIDLMPLSKDALGLLDDAARFEGLLKLRHTLAQERELVEATLSSAEVAAAPVRLRHLAEG